MNLKAVVLLAALFAVPAIAAERMKAPLYGDPAHPDISGMWNPEFAYLGPPIGAAAGPPRGGPPGAPGAGAPGAGPPGAGPPRGARPSFRRCRS